jgi:ribokinase
MSDASVIVVGSINVDHLAAVARRPTAGETVLASGYEMRGGGKGASQAAAAARAGAAVIMVGAVGDDPAGREQLDDLARGGVDVSRVAVLQGMATGMAFITVTPEGENAIVVASGANAAVSPDAVGVALRAAPNGAVVVTQLETGVAVAAAVAEACQNRGLRFALTTAPFAPLPPEVLAAADPLVANETEARQLCSAPDLDRGDLAAAVLRTTGARSVVVTLGAAGAVLATAEGTCAAPAPTVQVVDTTGAGDAFVGALAAALARGEVLDAAMREAISAATEAVGWVGARPLQSLAPLAVQT